MGDTSLATEVIYPISFTQPKTRFVLSLHYNGSSSFVFLNVTKIYQFKSRDSEIKDFALCLDNISKDFTINNRKKTWLKGIVKFLFTDFNPIDTNDILDIHRYFMKEK